MTLRIPNIKQSAQWKADSTLIVKGVSYDALVEAVTNCPQPQAAKFYNKLKQAMIKQGDTEI